MVTTVMVGTVDRDEKELGETTTTIASLSFGADRIFSWRKSFLVLKYFKLTYSWSLLLMQGETQQSVFISSVEKDSTANELTFQM